MKRECMNKVLICLICVLSLGNAIVDMQKQVPLAQTLKVSAEELNRSLPVMIDDELRHDKVEVNGNTMVFKFTLVNFTANEMSAEELKNHIETDIRVGLCTDLDTQEMLRKEMKVIYDYVGKNKNHITQFAYDAKSCGLESDTDRLKQLLDWV